MDGDGEGDSQETDGDFSRLPRLRRARRRASSRRAGSTSAPARRPDYAIILTMPHGATVDVNAASNGWYKVNYNGRVGWCSGAWLDTGGRRKLQPPGGGNNNNGGGGNSDGRAARASTPIMPRARSVEGFSYRWGGGCWSPGGAEGRLLRHRARTARTPASGAPTARASSPRCGRSRARARSRPARTPTRPTTSPTPTRTGRASRAGSARPADAFTYHSGGAGHIFLYAGGDSWGWMKTYECRGCSAGCGSNTRTAGSYYRVIRREGL